MKLLRRLLRHGAYGLVGVLALALGAVAVFTLTERGRSNLASMVSTAISGAEMRIEVAGIDGIWTGRLRAREVIVADAQGPWLALRGVEVDWSPLALIGFTFAAERVHANRIELARLPVASESSTSGGGFGLPVEVDVEAISLPDILLGSPLAGRVASLAAEGSLRVGGSPISGAARLSVTRTDGTDGTLQLTAAYLPQDNRIDLEIEGSEPSGGIIAGVLRLPGEPAVSIRASGSGPASDWSGKAEFAVDNQVVTRLSGRHQFTDAGSRIELDGAGAFASFLPATIAPLAAGDTSINFAGTIGEGMRIAVDNARLTSAALEATANGTVDPGGESNFSLSARATENTPRLVFGEGNAAFSLEIGDADVTLSGPPGELAINARASSPALGLPDYSAENVTVSAVSSDFDLATMTGSMTANVNAEAAGSSNEILAGLLAGGIDSEIAATFADGAISFETKSLRTGTASIAARGDVALADGAFAIDVAAQARSVVLPAAARPLLDETVALRGRVEFTGEGALTISGVEAKSGALDATGGFSLTDGVMDAAVAGKISDVSRLSEHAAGASSFSLSANGEVGAPTVAIEAGSDLLTVAGRDIETLRLTGRLVADAAAPSGEFNLTGSVGGEPLLGGGTLAAAPGGGGEVRDFAINLGANSLEGELTLDRAFRPRGTVTFNLPDIAPLAALALAEAKGAGRGSVRLEIVDDKPVATLDALVDYLEFGETLAGEVRVNATASNYLVAPEIAGAASAGRIVAGKTEIREVTLSLAQDAGWTRFDGRMVADNIPASAKGRVQYVDGRAVVELSAAEAAPRGLSARLAAPTTLIWQDGSLRTENLTVSAAGGTATATGRVGAEAIDLAISLKSLPASAINSFAPGLDAGGTLTGRARVTGTASAPLVSFEANLAGGAIAQTRSAGFGAMDVAASGSYAGGSLRFDGRVGDVSGLGMTGGGTVNIAARSATIDLSGSVPFSFLTRRLAEQGVALNGAAAVSIAVRGSLFSPAISGKISTREARFVHAPSGIAVDDISADIEIGGGSARISTLTGNLSTGGRVAGSGSVGINPADGFPADLTLRVVEGRYSDGRVVTASFGGEVQVTGPLISSPRLSGSVSLGRTVITIPERLPGSLATLDVRHRNAPADVVRQEEELRSTGGGGGSSGGGLTLDLSVSAPQQIFIVGRGLDAELGGNLRLTGQLSSPQAVGRFTMRRGRLSLLGRRLEFTSGSVGFSGSLVPYLDLSASSRAEGATVTVTVTGPATDPTFSFQSSPSLPEDEVLARLVFGKAMSGLSPVQIAQLAAAVGQLAGIGGSTSFLERLRERIGVDDIDVRTDDETGDTSVAVGKYLNDRTYLTLEKGTQPGSGKATIDLDVGGGLKLRGEATDAGQTRGGIFYEREY